MRLRRVLASLVTLLLMLGLVAGCSSARDDTDSATDASTDTADGEGATATGSADGAGEALTSSGATAGGGAGADAGGEAAVADVAEVDLEAVPIAAVDRKIIYTGTTHADVEDIGSAVRAARDAALAEGGFVFAQDLGAEDGRVVLKVPVDRFDAVFDAIVGIGEIEDQQIEAEDVTERFVDLESRQATLATSIDRIRGFLAEATNVDEISRLELELTRREAEHDVIAGQLRVLRDRTTYGTITAHFRLVDDAAETLVEEEEAGGPPGFGAGLSTGWDAVTTVAAAAATALGFLLPFAPVLVAAALLTWWWTRRRSQPPAPAEA